MDDPRPVALHWIQESPPYWDAAKARIVGSVPTGALHLAPPAEGELAPGDWWRVERDGAIVGYGWLDAVWGDAEINLVVDPAQQGKGVGSFILNQLAGEAAARGLLYVFNAVPEHHPTPDALRTWLGRRGFRPNEDGRLLRRPTRGT